MRLLNLKLFQDKISEVNLKWQLQDKKYNNTYLFLRISRTTCSRTILFFHRRKRDRERDLHTPVTPCVRCQELTLPFLFGDKLAALLGDFTFSNPIFASLKQKLGLWSQTTTGKQCDVCVKNTVSRFSFPTGFKIPSSVN